MKRGGPLRRLTPLKAKTPLRSTARLITRTPLKAASAKRQRENQTRAKVIGAIKATQIEHAGCVYCVRCRQTDESVIHGHELRSRAQGGSITDPGNIVLLCNNCNEWCEDFPIEAAAAGWKLSRKHGRTDNDG